jgi:cbb3-type cytochrome oxidase maturation protein
MDSLLILIPVALSLGLIALIAFTWAMRDGQFDDLDGAAVRILFDDETRSECAANDTAPRRPT